MCVYVALSPVHNLRQVMHPDAAYVHPFERGAHAQQQQQQQHHHQQTDADIPVNSRPQTSQGFKPNDTDWRLLALASTKRTQQLHRHQSESAANLAVQRSSSALNPLSNERDIENTLSAAAASSGLQSAAALQTASMQCHNSPRAAAGWTVAELCHIKVKL